MASRDGANAALTSPPARARREDERESQHFSVTSKVQLVVQN